MIWKWEALKLSLLQNPAQGEINDEKALRRSEVVQDRGHGASDYMQAKGVTCWAKKLCNNVKTPAEPYDVLRS